MEKMFHLKENGTDVRTEVTAGITTFLAMVYILAVNPNILSASGMDSAAVFTATAISAAIGTLIMAFFANYPVAMASGMGLNAYFAFSVCGTLAKAGVNDPWKIALAAVFCEGIIFVLLSFTNFREKLVNEYPYYAKSVIPANTYNNKEDVEGVFVYNIMLVRKDLPDEMVYDMLTGIFENIATIKASHNAANKNIDITFGVDDIQLPLHPGAEEFWKDNGYIK